MNRAEINLVAAVPAVIIGVLGGIGVHHVLEYKAAIPIWDSHVEADPSPSPTDDAAQSEATATPAPTSEAASYTVISGKRYDNGAKEEQAFVISAVMAVVIAGGSYDGLNKLDKKLKADQES